MTNKNLRNKHTLKSAFNDLKKTERGVKDRKINQSEAILAIIGVLSDVCVVLNELLERETEHE